MLEQSDIEKDIKHVMGVAYRLGEARTGIQAALERIIAAAREAEGLREKYGDEAWMHAACLTIVETGQKWGDSINPSPAMEAVYRLRQERDDARKQVNCGVKDLSAEKCAALLIGKVCFYHAEATWREAARRVTEKKERDTAKLEAESAYVALMERLHSIEQERDTARREKEEAERQAAELTEQRDRETETRRDAVVRAAQAESRERGLREDLLEFGRHSEGCSRASGEQYRCRCGWSEVEAYLSSSGTRGEEKPLGPNERDGSTDVC